MSRQVIIAADDFGSCHAVNEAVLLAHRQGVLTSASLMVTGDACDEAVAMAREHPGLAVGLHLALTGARPALPPGTVPHLLGADLRLEASPARAGLRWVASAAARRELRLEIAAQFERFAATGLALAHVDGHQHLHVHPAVFPRVVELAVRHGARGIRLPVEGSISLRHARPRHAAVEALVLGLLARRWRPVARRRGLAFTDRVHGILRSGAMGAEYVAGLLSHLREESVEIYLHPSTVRIEARGGSAEDLAALLHPALRDAVRSGGLELASYSTLRAR